MSSESQDASQDSNTTVPALNANAERQVATGAAAVQVAQIASKAIDATTEVAKTIREIATSTSLSQVEAQATIKAAIDSSSEPISECAGKMESDEGRIKIAEVELEREREKTKQAEIAAEANRDNNSTWRFAYKAATFCVVVVAVIFGGPQALKEISKSTTA